MKFTPFNIKSQQFNKTMRGYNKEEVKMFLEKIADELETLNAENESLKKELEKANSKLTDYRKIEKNLQDTLLKIHESSSKAVDSAKKQSILILKEAELKANQVLEKAKESADEIRSSVLNLREEKNVIIARLKAIITSQAGIMEIGTREFEEKPLKKFEETEKLNVNIEDILEKLL